MDPVLVRNAMAHRYVVRSEAGSSWPSRSSLADRDEVSIEEIAGDDFFDLPADAPEYWRDFHVPRATPGGKPLRRRRVVSTPLEILTLIGAGQGVSPMVASMSVYYSRPDVRYLPITDMSLSGRVWKVGCAPDLLR